VTPGALGIDVGTTAVKAVVVDVAGQIRGEGRRAVETQRRDGTATQDPEALWAAVVGAARDALDGSPVRVEAIGVCSQYSSIVPVDAAGRPVAELVTYLDHRGTDHCLEILARHPDAFTTWIERHGIPPVGDGLSLAHVLHFQHDRPDVHARTCAYLEPMDFVNLRLTGRITATQCTMFAAQLCDNRRWDARYDDDLVSLAGVDADRLPPLVAVDGWAGELADDPAARLGLAAGIPVAVGMNDSHAGAYATGAFAPDRLGVVIGTTAVVLAAVEGLRTDLEHAVLSVPSPEVGRHLLWAENGLAGKAVEHVLGLLCAHDALGDHRCAEPFAALEPILTAPARAERVLFLPWLAGSLSPRAAPAMRGGFLNLSLDTTRADLVRGAVEGTALNLAWLLEAVDGFLGRRIDEVTLGGGAARSAGWTRVLADVLDRPVRPLLRPEVAVARAVALVALRRAGAAGRVALPAEIDDGVLVRCGDPVGPGPAAAPRWAPVRRAFEAAFDALGPLTEALRP
jgi:xylulokinase